MTTTLEQPTVQQPTIEPSQAGALLSKTLTPEPLHSEEPTRRLWTRADYHKAGELGFFGMEERLELINGEIWKKMSPQGAPHAFGVGVVAEVLRGSFPAGFHIREEKPLVLTDLTEPIPDAMVVRGTLRQNPGFATSANAVLVVEISASSLKFDQTVKAESYARSGIPNYWILNQRARQLEVRREPGLLGDGQWGYRSRQIVSADGQVSPPAAPDVVINVADLLPSLPQSPLAVPGNSTPVAQGQLGTASDAPQND